MKYCRIQTASGPQFAEVLNRNGEPWVERLIPPFEEDTGTHFIEQIFAPVPLSHAPLLSPVVPSKIICVGRNYLDHARELANDVPAEPLLFLKPPSSILPSGGSIRLPAQSERVDFEGELALVIGEQCSKIGDNEDFDRFLRGYTLVNDVTARDLQKKDGQWSRAKGFDTFCPVGPVVSDELDLEAGIQITTRVNGQLRQQGNTRDLIFPIGSLLRYITSIMTLYPGDLIATGTPAGVGPMAAGDFVEIHADGIGTLANTVT
jgi:2-keto-4-pentenoate hydratase/2-oxohepta-3-ene-1,7-dioic acid hydratase in catechol pathway